MIRRPLFFLRIMLLGVFAAPVFLSCMSFAVSEAARIPEDFFGIAPGISDLNTEDVALFDDFNTVWIRNVLRWGNVEQKEGIWDFAYWDAYIARAEAAGKKIIIILGFDNPRLYSDNREHRDLTERELPHFLNYVEQVVRRYQNRVVYEIWNEPNWLFWDGSPEHFYALSAAAVQKIREVRPDATILAGSTARVSKHFTRGMFNAGALENVDGFSLHPYAASPKGTIHQIIKQQKLFDEIGFTKPVWVTEVGYSTGLISFCNIKRYPEYIVKTLSGLAVRAGGIRNLVWFEFINDYNKDMEPNRVNPTYHFGLAYADRTLKPGAKAFSLTAHNLAGSEYRPDLLAREGVSKNVVSLYFKRPGGKNILILWKDSPGSQRLHLSIPDTAELLRHDIHSGKAFPLVEQNPAIPADAAQTSDSTAVLELGREPVFITWMGEGSPRIRRP